VVEDESVTRVYTIPTTPQRAAAVAAELSEQLEALAGTRVETPFGVLEVVWRPSTRWGGSKPTVTGQLRMPGKRKVWDLDLDPYGPPEAWGTTVRDCDGLSRAQANALEELMTAFGEWHHRTQKWTVGAVGYGSASLVALEDLARKDQVKLGEYSRKHYARIFTDLTIAMLPAGAPERDIAVQLRRDGWGGTTRELLDATKLLAAAS
jgi:hypothetical protein